MSALRVVGIALAAVMMTLVLKKENGAAALAVSVAAGVIVLLSAVSDIMYLVSYLRGLVTKTPTAAEGLGVLLKCVGIGYIPLSARPSVPIWAKKDLRTRLLLSAGYLFSLRACPS